MRSQTFLPAKIYFNDKRSVFDCLVKNISSGGARLKISSPMGIPEQFTLFIPSENESSLCWIIWRNMSEIGVSFAPRPRVDGKPALRVVEDTSKK